MRNLLLAAASAAVLALGVAGPVNAASMVNADGTVNLDPSKALDPLNPFTFTVIVSKATGGDFDDAHPLSAQIDFRYFGTTDGEIFSFGYDLYNTTPADAFNPLARITAFGFDITGSPKVNDPSPPFDTTKDPGNFNGLGDTDVCFGTGAMNCNGGGGPMDGSVPFGSPLLGGTFSLDYDGTQPSLLLMQGFVVRFQSTGPLVGNDDADGSASGPGTAIPEPATWAMMIGGFGLVGAAMRRKKSAAVLA